MGIISNGSNPFAEFIEEVPYNIADMGNILPDDEMYDEPEHLANVAQEHRRTRKIKSRPLVVKPVDFTPCSRRAGAKKFRRYENTLQLLDLVNSDEFGEITIDDFVSQGMSAFSMLLDQPENMDLWNDFINCSEDEQTQFLMQQLSGPKNASEVKCSESSLPVQNGDQRAEHPAFNPDKCFRKIGNRFRALLKKKHLPMGLLAHLENEVTAFFEEWPRAVYISKRSNGYERLLLHALCQYLDLISASFDDSGERQTRVENPRQIFQTPSMLLTKYIEQHFRV